MVIDVKKIEAVIFDLDGVLIDSEPLWTIAEMEVFGRYGIKLSTEICSYYQGIRIEELTPIILKKYNSEHLDSSQIAIEILNKMYELLKNVNIMKGSLDLIDYYYKKGIPVSIASSSRVEYIKIAIDILGIEQKVSFVNSAEFEPAGKPEPFVFSSVAKHLKIEPSRCLVFEDSPYGILAAKRAGMNVVAIPIKADYDLKRFEKADLIVCSLLDWLKMQG